ncbi:hypothetical protein Nepgr_019898 [Nepenthes gracilis]|uniref:Peptidase M16 N-terminal domain-containing protein n=1 Tax=Nepenthes gracilis TaxID=150966 RepID=A0AAD3XUJ1_NEPGR|nr:hypothetical protein Nepgr_019898 [Nepenthes gracilis]
MGYMFDALKTCIPEMVELLVDSVRNPTFLDWEVHEQLVKLKAELTSASNNGQFILLAFQAPWQILLCQQNLLLTG